MRILVAEDEPTSCRILEAALNRWGYQTTICGDGAAAWEVLGAPDAPSLVILDWEMPGMDGPEVCRRLRERETASPAYVLLVTARGRRDDVVAGLRAGANDYLTKPFDFEELRARVQVGERMIDLQRRLAERVEELERALSSIKQLQGLLPICAYCKKIRDDGNYWSQVEEYVTQHSEARFSHSICPGCYESQVRPQLDALRRQRQP